MKKYKVGLIIGRFQPIHNGHISVIRKALEECSLVIVAVGSAQESYTTRNPFPFNMRKAMIEDVFPEEYIRIIPIEDRAEIANDSSWGDYVFKTIYEACGLVPEAIFEGEEAERVSWYDNLNVEIIKVPREDIPISATKIREAIAANDIRTLTKYMPDELFPWLDQMKWVIRNATKN